MLHLTEMAVIINSLYKYVLIFLFTLFIQTPIYASCNKSYTLGFFNGVWNTQDQATTGRDALRILIGDTYNNEPIRYESFYNHTGSSVGATALQDIAETFIQRSTEIDASGELGKRFEYFWEFIGSSEPTFIDKIKGIFSNAISLFDSLYTSIMSKLVSIISYFASNPPTETDYATHNAKLDALAADGQKLMLVGHSQGNLFMNHGYDHIIPTVGKDRVAAAHIAPASPTLRGDYVLANIDLVINALRAQGVNSVPDNNLDINVSKIDYSGHTLISTYLDPSRDGRGRVKTMIDAAMGEFECTRFIKEIVITTIVYGDAGIGFFGDCTYIPYLSNVPPKSETTEIILTPYHDGDEVPKNYIEHSVELTDIYFSNSQYSCGYDYYMLEHVIQHQYMLLN